MNDNDIIKALKCQLGIDTSNDCFGCLYRENKSCINASECILEVVEDLINRLKAENAELKQRIEVLEMEDELRWERDVALKEG